MPAIVVQIGSENFNAFYREDTKAQRKRKGISYILT